MAMLAKQVWRLIHNPESLCARVLKARYFPNVHVLNAGAGNGASYTWSITRGVELVKKGMIWRVGDGMSIDIWDDPWLPRGSTRKTSALQGPILLQRVSELIDPTTQTWKEELVRFALTKEDAEVVLAIPLRANRPDCLAWHFDSKGIFSVKSTYRVSVHIEALGHGPSSGITVQCPTMGTIFPWKKIWDIRAPNKVKHFAWRLAHNSLPLRRKIRSRGMEVDTLCPMCTRLDEDAGHLFFKCKHAKAIWRCLMLKDKRRLMEAASSGTELFRLIWQWEEEVQLLLIVALWVMWSKRNDTNAEKWQPSVVAGLIQRYFLEYKDVFQKALKPAAAVPRWSKPNEAWVKINSDGAFNPTQRSGGWGFIIRNHTGTIIGSGAGRIEHCFEALQADAQAAIEALQYACAAGITQVELEVDAINLREALNSER